MQPFLGQLMLCSWSFAAKGWALCNGQLLAINVNAPLFSLLGTYFGGNGQTTFGLPNLQGRTPIGIGDGFSIGNVGGEASHTLSIGEVPPHTHSVNAAPSGANTPSPSGALLAGGSGSAFIPPSTLSPMNSAVVKPFGGSQPHENSQPYLVMNWCIALQGIFPSRT